MLQVDVDDDLDRVDDDDLPDVQWHVLVQDEDRELCVVELLLDMMPVEEAIM